MNMRVMSSLFEPQVYDETGNLRLINTQMAALLVSDERRLYSFAASNWNITYNNDFIKSWQQQKVQGSEIKLFESDRDTRHPSISF